MFTNDILFVNTVLLDVLVYFNKFTFNDTLLEEHMIILTNEENENNYIIKIKIGGFAELLITKFTNKEFKFHFRLDRCSIKVYLITFTYYLLLMLKTKINVIYLI